MHSYICHLCPIVHDSENVPGPQLFHSSVTICFGSSPTANHSHSQWVCYFWEPWNEPLMKIWSPACCHESTSISFLMIGRCSLTCLCRKSWAVKKQQCSLLICRATADGHLAGGGGCLVARRTWAATRYHLKPCSSDSSGQASGSQSWNTAAYTLYWQTFWQSGFRGWLL